VHCIGYYTYRDKHIQYLMFMWLCIVDIVMVKNRLDATKYAVFYCLNSLATSSKQCSLQEAQCGKTQAAFQIWPPKSGRYSLIVLLMMGILVPETCWGDKKTAKAAYFVASGRFFTFTIFKIVPASLSSNYHPRISVIFLCYMKQSTAVEHNYFDLVQDVVLLWGIQLAYVWCI
jgi:hypothetical protein